MLDFESGEEVYAGGGAETPVYNAEQIKLSQNCFAIIETITMLVMIYEKLYILNCW
jgi:hypothetical protein